MRNDTEIIQNFQDFLFILISTGIYMHNEGRLDSLQ